MREKKKKARSVKGSQQNKQQASIQAGVIIGGAVLGCRVDNESNFVDKYDRSPPSGDKATQCTSFSPTEKFSKHTVSKSNNWKSKFRKKKEPNDEDSSDFEGHRKAEMFTENHKDLSKYSFNDIETDQKLSVISSNCGSRDIRISMEDELVEEDEEWCEASSHSCTVQNKKITKQITTFPDRGSCSHCSFKDDSTSVANKCVRNSSEIAEEPRPLGEKSKSNLETTFYSELTHSPFKRPLKSSLSLTDKLVATPLKSKLEPSKDFQQTPTESRSICKSETTMTKSKSENILSHLERHGSSVFRKSA